MKNKKILIVCLAVFLVAVAVGLLVLLKFKKNPADLNNPEQIDQNSNPAPYQLEFLSNAEKDQLKIPTDYKIQVLKRGDKGEVIVYKIIKDDGDIISDPSQVKAVSPRQK